MTDITLKWDKVAPMLKKRCNIYASVFRNMIVVSGGYDDGNKVVNSVKGYVVSQVEWSPITGLNHSMFYNTQVTCAGCVFTLGGADGDLSSLSSVEKLSSIDRKWEFVKLMFSSGQLFAAVTCKSRIYANGSWDVSALLKTAEGYCPPSDQWFQVDTWCYATCGHCCCDFVVKMYVAGHCAVQSIKCYDPSLDLWSIVRRKIKNFFATHFLLFDFVVVIMNSKFFTSYWFVIFFLWGKYSVSEGSSIWSDMCLSVRVPSSCQQLREHKLHLDGGKWSSMLSSFSSLLFCTTLTSCSKSPTPFVHW